MATSEWALVEELEDQLIDMEEGETPFPDVRKQRVESTQAELAKLLEFKGETARKRYAKMAKKTKPGSGKRFAALAAAIRASGTADDPEAVAAWIGRKKYGKKRFQQMAAQGRRRK